MFIDPGELDQNKVCTTIHLKNLNRSKNLRVSDFLEAFNDLFGFTEANLDSGDYPGTIFWFPLRKHISQLSDTIYSEVEVLNLLEPFIEESDKYILFANTVCKIDVFIERSSEKEGTMESDNDAYHSESRLQLQQANFGKQVATYTVQIDNTSKTLIKERQKLREKLIPIVKTTPEISQRWTFDVYIECIKRVSKEETKVSRSRWLIMNYLKGGELTEHTQRLLRDENLGYHHLVAIAGQIKDNNNDENHTNTGRLFCNQPLPQDNQTGLPVSINAQFALGNNRRQVKWEDKECLGFHTDKEIEWNHALVLEILPHAYLVLLQEMINLSKRCKNKEQFVASTYSLIPDIPKTDERWKKLGIEFLNLTDKENIFYAQYEGGGKWISTNEAILLSDRDEISNTISTLLTMEQLPFANIPENVDASLSFLKSKVQKMSPDFLRLHMMENTTYKKMSCQQKQHLLQYLKPVLIKGGQDLYELELIPLADGSFTCLRWTDIFIEEEEVINLFPGNLSKFVSIDIQSETKDIVQAIALNGMYNNNYTIL